MRHRIVTKQYQSTISSETVDDYKDKLFKIIPSEIIAFWIASNNAISTAQNVPAVLPWIVFILGVILTPFWTWRKIKSEKSGTQDKIIIPKTQLIMTTISFIVWIFAIGGPFSTLKFYNPLYGTLLMFSWTTIAPLFNPPISEQIVKN